MYSIVLGGGQKALACSEDISSEDYFLSLTSSKERRHCHFEKIKGGAFILGVYSKYVS